MGADGLDGLSTAWFCVRSCAQPSQYVGGMVTRSVLTRVAVSLTAAALLAGCGGNDTPPAAKAHSKAGAEAFVRAYFAAFNQAWTTPTAAYLGSYGAPSCKSCAASLATAAELVAKKHRYDGAPATIKSVDAIYDRQNDVYRVKVSAVQERRNIVSFAGRVISKDPRQPSTLEVALVWFGDRWKIATVKRVA